MSETKTTLRILTPSRELFNDDVNMVIMRSVTGDIGVLPGHQPLITTLGYGLLKIKKAQNELVATMFGGFADVQPNSITILTDSAEWLDEIDIERANKSKERALQRLKTPSEVDVIRAELSLKRALLRIQNKK